MTFYKDISLLHSLHNQQTLFYSELLARMENNQLVHLTPNVRKQIVKNIGSTTSDPLRFVRQMLDKLKKKGLISPCGGSTWVINPRLHGHSNLKSVIEKKEKIFLKITYGDHDEREMYAGKLRDGVEYND